MDGSIRTAEQGVLGGQPAVLLVLLDGPGWGSVLRDRVSTRSGGAVDITDGAMAQVLGRLRERGLVEHELLLGVPVGFRLTAEGCRVATGLRAAMLGLAGDAKAPRSG
jgi:DNA-binding PadR family transcriptional regulator